MPLFIMIMLGLMLGLMIVASVWSLTTQTPYILADSEGLTVNLGGRTRYEWADILSAERAPRVEQIPSRTRMQIMTQRSYAFAIFDAWRPIDLKLKNYVKYGIELIDPPAEGETAPEWVKIRLGYFKRSGNSAELLRCIQHYIQASNK